MRPLKQFLLGCVLILAAVAPTGAAMVSPAWVALYDSPRDPFNAPPFDEGWAMGVDATGNVYVAGGGYDTNYHQQWVLLKYNAEGALLWTRALSGPDAPRGSAYGLALTAGGEVIVVGHAEDPISPTAVATIKFDGDGNILWQARYGPAYLGSDLSSPITVDAQDNVYVIGSVWRTSHDADCVTLKYDRDGHQLWVAHYDGPAHREERAQALAVDGAGSVYVTGSSVSHCFLDRDGDENCPTDLLTVKYDANGQELWVARYDGPGASHDRANAIALDAFGHVYVAGFSFGRDFVQGWATIKYTRDGQRLWVARRNSPGDYSGAMALAVDRIGHAYVTGPGFHTIKYGVFGQVLWEQSVFLGYPAALALDAHGNVCVGGSGGVVAGAGGFAAVKFDPFGNVLWSGTWNDDTNSWEWVNDLALDRSGNLHLTGSTDSLAVGDPAMATLKFAGPTNPLPPLVDIRATDPVAVEGGLGGRGTATFTLRRTGETTAPLPVLFVVGGTASNGVDYETLGGLAVFPAGFSTTQILIRVRDDRWREGLETVRVKLEGNPQYRLGSQREAVAFIVDNDRHFGRKPMAFRSILNE